MRQAPGDIRSVWDAMTDRQLIEAYAASRDARAFGVFVGRHEAALLSFAAAFLRDHALAQDVVQETFLRVARAPERLLQTDGAGERTWLLKVVRNLSVDNLRRKAAERHLYTAVGLAQESRLEAGGTPADAPAQAQEEATRVRAAVDRLKPRLRDLLILKVREGKSYKEIAAITGLSVTNVGYLLHEAMQALLRELKN
jgi:RNA polymerase sigma-70 factor, ECF subfamily